MNINYLENYKFKSNNIIELYTMGNRRGDKVRMYGFNK